MAQLFSSPEWITAWRRIYGPGFQLIALQHSRLHLYSVVRSLKIFKVKSIGPIGIQLPKSGVIRAEYNHYLDWLSLTSEAANEIKQLSWQELYLPDAVLTDAQLTLLQDAADKFKATFRIVRQEPAYKIQTKSIEHYKKSLSYSTRRHYFSRKDKLIQTGDLSFSEVSFSHIAQVDAFFDQLNQFAYSRWGKAALDNKDIEFIKCLDEILGKVGGRVILSRMYYRKTCVSCIVDVSFGGENQNLDTCNLQLAYLEHNLAFGSLHLGQRIEASLKRNSIYYLLAGRGKHSNYKQALATHQDILTTCVYERGWLKRLSTIYAWLKP